MIKPRILLVSYTIPENKMGGGLLLHRHFVQRSDYEIGILTDNPGSVPVGYHRFFPEAPLLARLKRTRFATWAHDYTHLVHARTLDRNLVRAAREFQPNLIFTVAENYLSFRALKLARHLKVPFAAYFMDWAHFAACQHRWVRPLMDRMFRQLYQNADLALCISDGMLEELGPHPNARVIYPTSADWVHATPTTSSSNDPFEFCFVGNLSHWYGQQVANIITLCEDEPGLALRVFGTHHNWSEAFERKQRECGVFLGFKPFEELIPEFQRADAFLLPMGFDPAAALIERTSFKTKFLDYLLFGKPILVWGPEYCTAVRVAREYNAALCVTDPRPEAAIAGMRQLATEPALRAKLIANARMMREATFNNDAVYRVLKGALDGLVARTPHSC